MHPHRARRWAARGQDLAGHNTSRRRAWERLRRVERPLHKAGRDPLHLAVHPRRGSTPPEERSNSSPWPSTSSSRRTAVRAVCPALPAPVACPPWEHPWALLGQCRLVDSSSSRQATGSRKAACSSLAACSSPAACSSLAACRAGLGRSPSPRVGPSRALRPFLGSRLAGHAPWVRRREPRPCLASHPSGSSNPSSRRSPWGACRRQALLARRVAHGLPSLQVALR